MGPWGFQKWKDRPKKGSNGMTGSPVLKKPSVMLLGVADGPKGLPWDDNKVTERAP